MGCCTSIAVVCWIHLGSILSYDIPEPLSLGVDGCIQEGANFSEIALASYASIMGTWRNFYDTLTEVELDSLSAAVGHAGGFAVLCGFLTRDILRHKHYFGTSKFNGAQDNSYYVPAWIELRNWNFSLSEDLSTHLPYAHDAASTECFPSISYDKSAFENQRNYTARNMFDASTELDSSIQIIMNRFGSYLDHPCLGDILHVILGDFLRNGEEIKGNEWTAGLIHLISSTPHLKYGLRNLYFCIVNNQQIRTGLEELFTPLNPHLSSRNNSPRLEQLCHIQSVWKKQGAPDGIVEILLNKLNLTLKQLKQCYYLPNMTIDVKRLTPDQVLRIHNVLSKIKHYEEKEAKQTFQETLVVMHLTELLGQFLYDMSEKKLIQFRNPDQDEPRKGQWQYDCVMSLIKIFEKPLLSRYRRAWFDLGWWIGNSKTTRQPPQKMFSLFPGDHQILKTIQTSTEFEDLAETNLEIEELVPERDAWPRSDYSVTPKDDEQNQLTTKRGASVDALSSPVVTLMGIDSEIITSEVTSSTESLNQLLTSQTFSLIEPSTTTQPMSESMNFSPVEKNLTGTPKEAASQPSQFSAITRSTQARETSPIITQNGSAAETLPFDGELHLARTGETVTATMSGLTSVSKSPPVEWIVPSPTQKENDSVEIFEETVPVGSEKEMLMSANQSTVGKTTVSNLKNDALNSDTERINITQTPFDYHTLSEEAEVKIGTEVADYGRSTTYLKTAKQEILPYAEKESMLKTNTQKSNIKKAITLTTTTVPSIPISKFTQTNLPNQITTQTESTTFKSPTDPAVWFYSPTDSMQNKFQENKSTDTTEILPSAASKKSIQESKYVFKKNILETTTTQQINVTSFNVSEETSIKLNPAIISNKSKKYGRREVEHKSPEKTPVDEKELYLFTLFETVMKHDFGSTTIDLAAGTLTQNSAVYLIRMALYVLYGYDSVSPDFIIQDYIQRVKAKEEEHENV